MSSQEYIRWRNDRGDDTHIVDYPLNENSWVIELGGYQGLWTKKIYDKFKCNILVVEPVPEFYETILKNFSHPDYNNKIRVENSAVGTEEKTIDIFTSGDQSSSYLKVGKQITIDCHPIEYFLQKHNIDFVDLVQINIEGEEYPLLEKWTSTDVLDKFKFIQVQFHNFIDECLARRSEIQKRLISSKFRNKFQYDFIWESWEKII